MMYQENLGKYEELECDITLGFAREAEKLGHGTVTESGYFVAKYPYYGAKYGCTAVYPIVK